MTTQEHELSKLTNSPPLTLTRLNVISYDHAAYMVIENLNKRAQLSDIIDHDNVIFIGTKIQDDKFFRIGKEESIFHKQDPYHSTAPVFGINKIAWYHIFVYRKFVAKLDPSGAPSLPPEGLQRNQSEKCGFPQTCLPKRRPSLL